METGTDVERAGTVVRREEAPRAIPLTAVVLSRGKDAGGGMVPMRTAIKYAY